MVCHLYSIYLPRALQVMCIIKLQRQTLHRLIGRLVISYLLIIYRENMINITFYSLQHILYNLELLTCLPRSPDSWTEEAARAELKITYGLKTPQVTGIEGEIEIMSVYRKSSDLVGTKLRCTSSRCTIYSDMWKIWIFVESIFKIDLFKEVNLTRRSSISCMVRLPLPPGSIFFARINSGWVLQIAHILTKVLTSDSSSAPW